MIWLDPLSPAVRAAVVSGVWGQAPHSAHHLPVAPDGEIDTITDALRVASDILTSLTGHAVHPAGTAQEDFACQPMTRRLTPSFKPVESITSVVRLSPGLLGDTTLTGWVSFQGSVLFGMSNNYSLSGQFTLGQYFTAQHCGRPSDLELIRVTYNFGSSITASARRAVLYLANQIWLEANRCQDCNECQLPERTTSVQREGLTYTLSEAADFLGSGRTGLPSVDSWVAGVNPRQALRRSSVYDPGAPPGVIHSLVNRLLIPTP